jgi:hypothetical protein
MVAWLQMVAQFASHEASFEPPQEVVVRAQSIFRPPESKDWIERLQNMVAKLVFDSQLNLQPAGVRSVESDIVRLLYRAGDYSIDLKVEPSEGVCDIVGQIANEQNQSADLSGAVVQIVAAGRTLGETETNQFGEFMIEQPEVRKATLRIALKRDGKRIDLPLQYRKQSADPS